MRQLISIIKGKIQEILAERRERHFRKGFEYAISAYYIYGYLISEIADEVSKKPDSFDMGVLQAIRIINREG